MSYANTFDNVSAQAGVIGHRLITKAIEEKDLDTVRIVREEVKGLYDGLIRVISEKLDYAAWHKYFIDVNVNNVFHKLDTTGEFTRLVEELKAINAEGYYFTKVKPLMLVGIVPFAQERDQMLGFYDMLIDQMVQERRAEMRIVK